MDDYGTNDGYGGLAGFGGPALESSDAPVLRYQDLHRFHAPASAGAPEVGYGDVMSTPETGVYGDVAVVNGAGEQQVPGYGSMSSSRPLYGGGYGEEPATAAAATAPAGTTAAPTAPTAPAAGASASKGAKAQKSQRDFDLSFLEELGRGAVTGLSREAGVSRFESSGKATTPVVKGGGTKQTEEKSEWQTYAIWGGATLLGVGAAYFLYRAYSKKGAA